MAESFSTEAGTINATKSQLTAKTNEISGLYSEIAQYLADIKVDSKKALDARVLIQNNPRVTPAPSPSPSPAPAPSPSPAPAPAPAADPLMPFAVYNGTNGAFNATQYRTVAASMGSENGIAYAFGPGPVTYGTSGNSDKPTLFMNQDKSADDISTTRNPGQPFARGCTLGACGSYQLVGGVPKANEAGMYSSNMGQLLFIPNTRDVNVSSGMGISDYCTYETGSNIVQTKPEFPWQYGGQGANARQYVMYRNEGKDISYPVAIGRAEGRPGWCISNVIAHKNGLLTIGGAINGSNRATAQLATGLVPTAVCQMNSNEFALVTCWDTVNLKGKVAVVALAGTPENRYLGSNPATWDQYRGEWRGVFPGMPNYGNISFMKIVGYVDLPDNMKCPTGISATTAHYWGNYTGLQDKLNNTGFNLLDAGDRKILRDTKYFCFPPSAVACVISKEEKTACFIDFGAMFKFYRDSYMVEPGLQTAVGTGAGQFPPTFTENTAQKPVIIKTISLPNRPGAVRLTRYDLFKRAYIATQDGTLHMYDLGAYPLLGGNTPSPDTIKLVGTVPIGRNPTWIATVIRHAGAAGREGGSGEGSYFGKRVYENANFDSEIMICCRGDRKIQWVKFNSNWTGGSVNRTVLDTRLADPIWCEDSENHTTEHYEVLVADYAGSFKSYRYGNHIWWDYEGYMNDGGDNIYYSWGPGGLAPNGFTVTPTTHTDGTVYKIECGGVTNVLGKPFMGGFANVY